MVAAWTDSTSTRLVHSETLAPGLRHPERSGAQASLLSQALVDGFASIYKRAGKNCTDLSQPILVPARFSAGIGRNSSIVIALEQDVRRRALTFESFDRAYLDRLQSGDRSVEDHFVRYFTSLITLKMRSRGWDRETTDDVLQETFARALALVRKPAGVQQPASLGALVNTICNNVLREHCRAKGRTEALDEETAALLTEPRQSALAQMVEHDTGAAVARVLQEISPRDRELLRAVLMDEADKDAVCKQMSVSRDHLRVLLHRAKNAFRSHYLSDVSARGTVSRPDTQRGL